MWTWVFSELSNEVFSVVPCVDILQEVCTLLLAAFLMGDKMSMLNWLGFAVCLCGISLHVGLKTYYSKSKFYLCFHHIYCSTS